MNKINNIGLARELTSCYDFHGFTEQEVWARIAQKMNIIIEHFNYLDNKINNANDNYTTKLDYLLNEGLSKELAKMVLLKINDGTIGQLINETLFKDINDKIINVENNTTEKINNIKTEVDDIIKLNFNSINDNLLDIINKFKTETNNSVNEFKTETDILINEFKTNVNNELKKYECFIICTNVKQLENAIEKVGTIPSIIYLVNGTYVLTKTLYIPSNTKIVGLGNVTIKADGLNCYFINKSIEGALGYTGSKNIHIENIFFDGKGKADGLTMVAFGHAENVTIKNCIFYDLHMWHMVEFNAIRHGLITGCKFSNYGNVGSNGTEAIQLDSMLSQAQFPWFGAYDDTPCKFITIENNIFEDINKIAIGNHNYKKGIVVQDVVIKNNLFNRVGLCIQLRDFDNLLITENKAYDMHGFFMSSNAENDSNTLTISKNAVQGFFINSIDGLGDERFVGINTTGKNGTFNFYHVVITENDVSLLPGHAIGVIADYLTITNNNFYRIYRNGIYFWGGQCANISNNNFRDTGMGSDTARYSILVNGGGAKCSRVVISSNTIANLKGIAVKAEGNGVEKVLVSNNISAIVNEASSNCTATNNIN